VVLDVTKMDVNAGVRDEQFVLEQPEGTTLQEIGKPVPPPPGKKGSQP
jgi:hypothetical protein